ncbi:ATP phosphoribosyltransferase [Legionella gratiana]|uniref:ATP phosphoribosyltransferase n=1 Tax=Legionella gratiana TaxID=45066 RepID=A0A378JEC6_9GAMM|nr:ATP phosphoribosyltransferase [Legionella gratiana]KTD06520.1 ATP phosphoribosyltransferase [Legionella gratiana]STX45341.1 ATP phosphoribosyltransferase [Legionella gratiana]
MKNRLRLALQKRGRLSEESLSLLQQCGLKFRIKPNSLLTHVDNFPIDLLFVRDDDIPTLVFDGLCDGGIVGENVLLESALANPEKLYKTIVQLGNCTCRLSIAIPEAMNYQGPGSLDGKRIATSYPNLLKHYLNKQKICAEILVLSGSIEVAPRMGMADAICDLVSTGQTLEDNKLYEVDTLLQSQAVLIQGAQKKSPLFQDLFEMLARRILAVQQAQERKYIVFHAPKSALEAIAEKLPGAESPTILPLPGTINKVAVHVVSSERIFWKTLETIQTLGASSILVLPIEKMLE